MAQGESAGKQAGNKNKQTPGTAPRMTAGSTIYLFLYGRKNICQVPDTTCVCTFGPTGGGGFRPVPCQ